MKSEDQIDDMADLARDRAGWTSDGDYRPLAFGDGLRGLSSEFDDDREREERTYARGVEAGLRWVRGHAGAPLAQEITGPATPPDEEVPSSLAIPLKLVEEWAGRSLTEDEVTRLLTCIPHSSIPDAVGTIVAAFAETPDD